MKSLVQALVSLTQKEWSVAHLFMLYKALKFLHITHIADICAGLYPVLKNCSAWFPQQFLSNVYMGLFKYIFSNTIKAERPPICPWSPSLKPTHVATIPGQLLSESMMNLLGIGSMYRNVFSKKSIESMSYSKTSFEGSSFKNLSRATLSKVLFLH